MGFKKKSGTLTKFENVTFSHFKLNKFFFKYIEQIPNWTSSFGMPFSIFIYEKDTSINKLW